MHALPLGHPFYHPKARGLRVQTSQNMTHVPQQNPKQVARSSVQARGMPRCQLHWMSGMIGRQRTGWFGVIVVIAHMKRVSHKYAGQLCQHLWQSQRVSVCEARPLPPRVSVLTNTASPTRRSRRGCCRPAYSTPVANADQMSAILWQRPGTLQCCQTCT